MYLGRVVEEGPTAELIASPRPPLHREPSSPLSRSPAPTRDRAALPIRGSLSDAPLPTPAGCPFPRPLPARDAPLHHRHDPQLLPDLGTGRRVACHLVGGHVVMAPCDPVTLEIIRGAIRAAQSGDGGTPRAHRHFRVHPREEGFLHGPVRRGWASWPSARTCRSSATSAGPVFKHFPIDTIRPGDLFWYNDCYGSRRRRIPFQRPGVPRPGVPRRPERRCAFVMGWAHFSDIGGLRPGSISPDATDIFQEGIIIPPTKTDRPAAVTNDACAGDLLPQLPLPRDLPRRHACADGERRAGRPPHGRDRAALFARHLLADALAQLFARTENAGAPPSLRETFPGRHPPFHRCDRQRRPRHSAPSISALR